MSALGDALTAIRNVVLMQERIDVMNRKMDRMSEDVKGLNEYARSIDLRVVRIETMVEMGFRSGHQPCIEG